MNEKNANVIQCTQCLAVTNDGNGCAQEGCPVGVTEDSAPAIPPMVDRLLDLAQALGDERAPLAVRAAHVRRELAKLCQKLLKAPDGVLGMDGWSSERPNADGRWLWREGGKEHREVELVLCSGGAEVADAGEVEEGAPQYYWQRTPTNEHFMPGLWKRAPGVAVGHPPSLYDLVPPSAAEWLSDVPPGTPSGAASTDWHQGWDACRNRCRTLVDNALASKEPHPAPTTPGVALPDGSRTE